MSASARRKIVEQYQTIEQLTARVAELEAENELLKGRKNVELAANTDNAKSKQQRELAGPMEMGQLLAGSTHKTSGDLEIERTKPVTWIHKGGGFISDSRGKFIGCFSGDFRYRDRIICAVNSESETSNQLAAEQLNNKLLRDALQEYIDEHEECQDADDWMAMMCSMEAHHTADEALAQPSDTSALDAYVAEKVKDSESRTGNQSPCYTIARDMAVRMWEKHYKTDAPNWEPLDDFMGVLSQISNMLTGLGNVEKITRQRDLAVEALKWLKLIFTDSEMSQERNPELWMPTVEEAIKESEAK